MSGSDFENGYTVLGTTYFDDRKHERPPDVDGMPRYATPDGPPEGLTQRSGSPGTFTSDGVTIYSIQIQVLVSAPAGTTVTYSFDFPNHAYGGTLRWPDSHSATVGCQFWVEPGTYRVVGHVENATPPSMETTLTVP